MHSTHLLENEKKKSMIKFYFIKFVSLLKKQNKIKILEVFISSEKYALKATSLQTEWQRNRKMFGEARPTLPLIYFQRTKYRKPSKRGKDEGSRTTSPLS
jgi:hypothetical protein